MTSMRTLVASLAVVAALAASGCGASSDPPAAADGPATLAPKDAGALLVVDTDQSSAQWKSVKALLAGIPGGEKAISGALSQAGGTTGLSLQQIGSAFGRQLVVVVPASAKQPILLAKPDDPKQLAALLAKRKQPHVTGQVDGWTAVAVSQQALDAYQTALAKGTLASSDDYAKAVAALPADALVLGYAHGSGLNAAARSAGGAVPSVAGAAGMATAGAGSVDQIGTVGFAVSAQTGALRIDGSFSGKNGATPTSYSPTLLGQVPSDAFVAVSFDGAGQLQQAVQQALGGAGASSSQIEKQLGVQAADLLAAFDGEGVVYVRPSLLIPEITVAVKPKDVARTRATFDALAAKLGGSGATAPIQGLKLTTATVGDVVLISTSTNAASSLGASGPKLVDTDRFKQAAQEVGLGGKTSGFAYVDVHALGPLLKTVLGALGSGSSSSPSTDQAFDALLSLDTVAAAATVDGSRTHFAAVVRVR